MSKLLTILIPVYNTEKYLQKCINSLLIDGITDKFEILIVIDGSPDNSIQIANKFKNQYPKSIHVINKINAGHGSTINEGLKIAKGKYFRVLDSDDWFNRKSFSSFLSKLELTEADLVMSHMTEHFVYKKTHKRKSHSDFIFDKIYNSKNIIYTKYDVDFFGMARCTYKTDLLKKHNLNLIENIFFEDSFLHVFHLLFAKTIVFFDDDIYNYLIGRADQSVSIDVTLNHITYWYKIINQILEFKSENSFPKNKLDFIEKVLHVYIWNQYGMINKLDYKTSKNEILNLNKYLKQIDNNFYFNHVRRKISENTPYSFYWFVLNTYESINYYIRRFEKK